MLHHIQSQFKKKVKWRKKKTNAHTLNRRIYPKTSFRKYECLKRKVFVVNLILKFNFHICMHYTITSCVISSLLFFSDRFFFVAFFFLSFQSAFHLHLFAAQNGCLQTANWMNFLFPFVYVRRCCFFCRCHRRHDCTLKKVQSFTVTSTYNVLH